MISVGIYRFLTISYHFSAIYFHVENMLPPSVNTRFAIVTTLANDLLNYGLNIGCHDFVFHFLYSGNILPFICKA